MEKICSLLEKHLTGKELRKAKKQSEKLLLELNSLFPDKKVVGLREENNHLLSKISPLFLSLGFADVQSMLKEFGFDYSYILKSESPKRLIEPIMKVNTHEYLLPKDAFSKTAKILPLLEEAFVHQPLIGNINVSVEEKKDLYDLASVALRKAIVSEDPINYGLKNYEFDIILLTTVLLLREWNGFDSKKSNKENQGFWEFIFDQYSIIPDYSVYSGSKEYRIFRDIIESSLKRHNRLFLSTGQKYYTTLLIHSLSPRQAFYDLFEQLLAFYAKTLSYQFTEFDPAFQAFSNAYYNWIKRGKTTFDDSIYLKSTSSTSATRALFLNCPLFMADFTESIVSSIDSLVISGQIQENNYTDLLLNHWYSNRSKEDKEFNKSEKSKSIRERIVTEYSNIRVTYHYDGNHILLSIPKIRLNTDADFFPEVKIYRHEDDENPFITHLETYGKGMLTTLKKEIVLSEIDISNMDRLNLKMIIICDGTAIYNSEQRLFRDAIAFNKHGDEILKRQDNIYTYVFIPEQASIRGLESAEDFSYEVLDGGKLYDVLFSDSTSIFVNEANLLPIELEIDDFKVTYEVSPLRHCKFIHHQNEHAIYTDTPKIRISSDDHQFNKKYRIIIDGDEFFLGEISDELNTSVSIPLPMTSGVHKLEVEELLTQKTSYLFRYTVFKDLEIDFHGFYYSPGYSDNGYLTVSWKGEPRHYPYECHNEVYTMLIPFEEGELILEVPYLQVCLDGVKDLFEKKQPFWHKDIPDSSSLKVNFPRGFLCTILIGKTAYSDNVITLGNILRVLDVDDILEVKVMIKKTNIEESYISLFKVAFSPCFLVPPITVENNMLVWTAEDNFIGNKASQFIASIKKKEVEVMRLILSTANSKHLLNHDIEDGLYRCDIEVKDPGFFSEYEALKEFTFVIGDPNKFRFEGQAIIITHGIIDNKIVELNESSGIIKDIKYIGLAALNGEDFSYHQYKGKLYYIRDNTLLPYAHADNIKNKTKKERVNPIKIWFINDFIISLRGPEDDGLHVNRKQKSITDILPNYWNEKDYCYTDYYGYYLIDEKEVMNV